jgi:hypothetical protein
MKNDGVMNFLSIFLAFFTLITKKIQKKYFSKMGLYPIQILLRFITQISNFTLLPNKCTILC